MAPHVFKFVTRTGSLPVFPAFQNIKTNYEIFEGALDFRFRFVSLKNNEIVV